MSHSESEVLPTGGVLIIDEVKVCPLMGPKCKLSTCAFFTDYLGWVEACMEQQKPGVHWPFHDTRRTEYSV